MQFRYLNFNELHKAEGTIIVIDVIRAGSTTYRIMESYPSRFFYVENSRDAWPFKKNLGKSCLLFGETRGKKPKTFDFDNSPTDAINNKKLIEDKIVFLRSGSGTKATVRCTHLDKSKRVIIGSFLCANKIVEFLHLEKINQVDFIITGSRTDGWDDLQCAKYIEYKYKNKDTRFDNYLQFAEMSKNIKKYNIRQDDVSNCLKVIKADFIPTALIFKSIIEVNAYAF